MSRPHVRPNNDEATEAWNGVLFDRFVQYRDIVTAGLGAHGEQALHQNPPAPGDRALDIGCGFGDTTQRLAEIVGPPFAGLLIGHALAGWYTLALVLGCVGAAAVTLAVERRLSPAVNGLGAPREPDVAGELALEVQRAKLSGE